MPTRQFLHRLFLRSGSGDFLPTTREFLRAQSFLDGRTVFANGPMVQRPAADVIAAANRAPHVSRLIFHVSFCGSTLLSRLLDVPGHALVLREPNCLADLANQYSADANGSLSGRLPDAVAAVLAHLAQPWAPGEAVVVKPSNWANNMLPLMCANPARTRPVFVHIERRAFVEAVIRGGPKRIAYTARSAVHLSNRSPADAELVAAALARDTDERGKIAALSIVAHAIQMRMFKQASSAGGWGDANWIAFDDLTRNPLQSARKAANALEIAISDGELSASVQRWSGVNAKQPELAFSSDRQADDERHARELHGDIIDSALAWADALIGP